MEDFGDPASFDLSSDAESAPSCMIGGYYQEGDYPVVDLSPGPERHGLTGEPDGSDDSDRADRVDRVDLEDDPDAGRPPAVVYVLAGNTPDALQSALDRQDPEDRYLDLILVAVACARRGEAEAARTAALRAVERYRPIVEEGLYVLYARYLAELSGSLPTEAIAAFVEVMEPEVTALGALPAAADPPLPFLALFNDLYFATYGWFAALEHARSHGASHLLLGDLARRAPADADLDQALAGLAAEAGQEARQLSGKAKRGADPFLRDRLRRALLRQVAALKALFDRTPDLAGAALWADAGEPRIPFEALSDMPRGLRLEALQALAAALSPLPVAPRAALYPHFLLAAYPPGSESGSMLRRQAGAVARITSAFLDAEPAAAGDLESLVDWFLAEDAYLGEGAAEEAVRNFVPALQALGPRSCASLEKLLDWAEQNAEPAAPAILAAWSAASGKSPTALRTFCLATPQQACRIVRECPPELRGQWAGAALANPNWNLRAMIGAADLDEQRAVADLLTYHPEPLADLDLAAIARSAIVGESAKGPYFRTLELLGPSPDPFPLAVLLDARVASRGYAAPELDQALRQIVAWALERDVNAALRMAAGFATRNHVSWLLGSLLADGAAGRLDGAVVRQIAPHPFLLGAYFLETMVA